MSEDRTTGPAPLRETVAWTIASAAVTLALGVTLGSLLGYVRPPDHAPASGETTLEAATAPPPTPPTSRVVFVPVEPIAPPQVAAPESPVPADLGDDDEEHGDDDGWIARGEPRRHAHGHHHGHDHEDADD